MNLENIVIILCRPEENKNIGAALRAMANNDISCIRIVGKKEDYDEQIVKVLAIHASFLWDKCTFFDSITDATKDCSISVGTTRRKGKRRKDKYFFPEEFAKLADTTTLNSKVAIVFGNERTGLTKEELDECTRAVTIPSSDNFASLNLSHAVQILCYHLYRQFLQTNKNINSSGFTPITLSRLNKAVDSITDNLEEVGFFKIAGKDDQKRFWTSILSRASLTEGEISYLEKIFTKVKGLKK